MRAPKIVCAPWRPAFRCMCRSRSRLLNWSWSSRVWLSGFETPATLSRHHPIEHDLQLVEIYRLKQVLIASGVDRFLAIPMRIVTGNDNDRQLRKNRLQPQVAGNGQPIQSRELKIQEYGVRPVPGGHLEGALSVRGREHTIAFRFQNQLHHFSRVKAVLGDEDRGLPG